MDTSTSRPTTPRAGAAERAILITGAGGYLGRMVVARLARAEGLGPLIAADVRPTPESERVAGVTYVELDVRDADAVDGVIGRDIGRDIGAQPVGVVVHLAAVVTPPRGSGRELAWDVDVRGTRHVLEACVAHGVGKIIVTSSGAAYGYHPDNRPSLTEDDPLRGNEVFAYSHHKRIVEATLADFRARHPELRQLVFRPGTILGEGTKNQITAIFERPVVLGIRGASSPFVFIWDEDVTRCIELGVREPERDGIYNLAGSGAMTLREIASELGKPYVALPAGVLRGALGVLERLGVGPYGPEQVIFLQHRPVLDNTRLREDFGYEPRSSREVFELYRRSAHA